MNDYITRADAVKAACKLCPLVCKNAEVCPTRDVVFRAIHAADVRPVVRGEWIETGSFDQYYQPIYECSHCHREVADYFMTKHLFCLHCGADMNMKGIL